MAWIGVPEVPLKRLGPRGAWLVEEADDGGDGSGDKRNPLEYDQIGDCNLDLPFVGGLRMAFSGALRCNPSVFLINAAGEAEAPAKAASSCSLAILR